MGISWGFPEKNIWGLEGFFLKKYHEKVEIHGHSIVFLGENM